MQSFECYILSVYFYLKVIKFCISVSIRRNKSSQHKSIIEMKQAEELLRYSYLPVVGSIFKSDIIPRENCFIVKVDVDVSKITK